MIRYFYCRLWMVLSGCALLFSMSCSPLSFDGSGLEQKQFSSPLGVSYRAEFAGVIRVIIESKYQYIIIREEESSREIYMETDWRDRTPLEDEIKQNILATRTRFIFRARPRHAGQYTIHMYADNEVIIRGTDLWQTGSFSPMLEELLNDIAKELRIEYKILF